MSKLVPWEGDCGAGQCWRKGGGSGAPVQVPAVCACPGAAGGQPGVPAAPAVHTLVRAAFQSSRGACGVDGQRHRVTSWLSGLGFLSLEKTAALC